MLSALPLAFVLLTATPAPAAPERPEPPRREQREDRRAQVEKRLRLMRLVELTEQIGLDEKQALHVNDVLSQFDEKKKAIHEDMKASRELVKRASQGDAAAAKDLDAAVDKLVEGRKKLLDVDRDLYRTLGKELNPQQRAKLAIFLAEFQHRLMRMANDARDQP